MEQTKKRRYQDHLKDAGDNKRAAKMTTVSADTFCIETVDGHQVAVSQSAMSRIPFFEALSRWPASGNKDNICRLRHPSCTKDAVEAVISALMLPGFLRRGDVAGGEGEGEGRNEQNIDSRIASAERALRNLIAAHFLGVERCWTLEEAFVCHAIAPCKAPEELFAFCSLLSQVVHFPSPGEEGEEKEEDEATVLRRELARERAMRDYLQTSARVASNVARISSCGVGFAVHNAMQFIAAFNQLEQGTHWVRRCADEPNTVRFWLPDQTAWNEVGLDAAHSALLSIVPHNPAMESCAVLAAFLGHEMDVRHEFVRTAAMHRYLATLGKRFRSCANPVLREALELVLPTPVAERIVIHHMEAVVPPLDRDWFLDDRNTHFAKTGRIASQDGISWSGLVLDGEELRTFWQFETTVCGWHSSSYYAWNCHCDKDTKIGPCDWKTGCGKRTFADEHEHLYFEKLLTVLLLARLASSSGPFSGGCIVASCFTEKELERICNDITTKIRDVKEIDVACKAFVTLRHELDVVDE